jgi:thiamine-phosphate pyrophosphorylase
MEHLVYRIIDANFNRAREAARVIEEYCRFVLNSCGLTGRVKELRHELSAAIASLDTDKLIASRDTADDVGVGLEVSAQLKRKDLNDCLTAGCKRLAEALRVLSEITGTVDPKTAKIIEQLRYTAYSLEKDVALFADSHERFRNVRLYVIITDTRKQDVISVTKQVVSGGADCIQLRAKGINDDEHLLLAREFVDICKDAGRLCIINDRVDIAVASDADGVHLGQNDLDIDQARKLIKRPLIIGKSTHGTDQLERARKENPAYLAVGPVFKSPTKPDVEAVGLGLVKKAVDLLDEAGIYSLAVGAVTPDNLEEVLSTGVNAVAVCSSICQSDDPEGQCRRFKQLICEYLD